MKKFGTPMGAGPGSAKENVGLAGVGTPLLVLVGAGAGGVFFFLGVFGFLGFLGFLGGLGFFGFGAVGCAPLFGGGELPGFVWEGCCPLPFPGPLLPADWGGFDLIVVVGVLEVVVVEDELWDGVGFEVVDVEVEVEVVSPVAVVVVVVMVPPLFEGHDWTILVIGRFTGSGNEPGRVPGGTFSKVYVLPPATVIATLQPAAEALGIAPRPRTATTEPQVKAAIFSFRLLTTVAYSSRRMPLANSSQLRSQIG